MKNNNLNYLAAFLGKEDNKRQFIENQIHRKLPKGKVLEENKIKKLKKEILYLNNELNLSFKENVKLSEVSEKLNDYLNSNSEWKRWSL